MILSKTMTRLVDFEEIIKAIKENEADFDIVI